MGFNYSALSGKIVEKFGTQYNFSIALGLSERSLSMKLNDKTPWKNTEIKRAIKLLGISKKDIGKYFFTEEVQKIEQTA